MATSIDVLDQTGKKSGSVDLPAEMFDVVTNVPLMHQVVVAQLAAARQGTHKVKHRGEVSGSGRKPFKQKGNRSCPSGFDSRPPAPWWWRRSRPHPPRLLAAHAEEDGRKSSAVSPV